MKFWSLPQVSMVALILMGHQLSAAEIIKADNADHLQNGSSWTGGVSPTVSDVAVWDASLSNHFAFTLSGATTWGGIKVTDIASDLTIDFSAALNFGDAVANAGIDMSLATHDVLIRSTNSQTINWSINPLVVNVAADRTLTIDAKFGATDRFEKIGEGTLVLKGSNDNGGTLMTLNAGTVVLAKNSSASWHALGGGTHTINGGKLVLDGSGNDQIYQSSTIEMNGGILDFNGRDEGWSRLIGSSSALITNTGTTLSTMTLGETDGNNSTFAGTISNGTGGLALVKTGTGTQSITGTNNSYAGGTTIKGGVLQIAEDISLGASTGQITLTQAGVLMNHSTSIGTITTNRQVNLADDGGGFRAGYNKNFEITGLITGEGSLRVQNDNGYVVLSNSNNNYNGQTFIGGSGNGNSARLLLNASEVLPNGTDVIFDAGGTLGSTSNVAILNLNGKTETINSLSTLSGFGNIISTNGVDSTTVANAKLIIVGNEITTFTGYTANNIHIEHNGLGELTLAGTMDNSALRLTVSKGTVVLAKASTSSYHALGGATHVINNGGILKLAGTGNDQIYFGSTVQINAGGTWDFAGVEFEDVNHISGSGLITNSAADTTSKLVLGTNVTGTTVHTFAGQINDGDGVMAFEKNGNHTLILNGNHNFSGGGVVNSGTLGGTGTVGNGPLTIKSAATISPGSNSADAVSLGAGSLKVNGSLTLESGSTFLANLAIGGNAIQTDRIILNGSLALEGANLNLVWGGNNNNLFDGTYNNHNMFWLTEGTDSISGWFANFSAVDDWGMFGGVEYAMANIDGQDYALFYNSQFGVYDFSGLTGGNDLLIIAVPEPSKILLFGLAMIGMMLRRSRCLQAQV